MADIDYGRIAGRVARAMREVYGHRVREVSWDTTRPTLLLTVELLGPVEFWPEMDRMADATLDISVEEGVAIVCKPAVAGRRG